MNKFLGNSWILPCLPQEEQSLRHCHLTIEILKHYSTKEIVEKETAFSVVVFEVHLLVVPGVALKFGLLVYFLRAPENPILMQCSKLLWQSGVPVISIHPCFYAYLLSNTDTECQSRLLKSMPAVLFREILLEEFREHSRREGKE